MNGLVSEALAEAVSAIGGEVRPGQQQMADSVFSALAGEKHLLVQAGTGTGKSLAYLVPALLHAIDTEPVIVSTATLALQRQLITKDIPVATAAVSKLRHREPMAAVLKGRSNYICLYRLAGVAGDSDEEALPELAASDLSEVGAQVLELRAWAEEQQEAGEFGDRDDAPRHSPKAWQQVSIPVRECLGAKCPFADECLVEAAKAHAAGADLVITNHALLAIDAMGDGVALPSFGGLIIDEAHDLTARVTSAASSELYGQTLERVVRRCGDWIADDLALDLLDASDALRLVLSTEPAGRVTPARQSLLTHLAAARDLLRSAITQLGKSGNELERTQALGAAKELFEVTERMVALEDTDVVWVSESEIREPALHVAPLSVSQLLRARVLDKHPTVLTSATLQLGGEFSAAASAVGLLGSERDSGEEGCDWSALDVGTPFDYSSQGILYLPDLPPPGRDQISEEALVELAELVWAAGGGCLGLFSSMRSAQVATEYLRSELPSLEFLCQGDAQLPDLSREFASDAATSLLGTLSLWQGIDIPGDACQLVVIDKIPFHRPDDPLMQARKQRVDAAGGSGFMKVSVASAALLLAQGSGRLIRSTSDRGVVAILDSRLRTKGYGSYLLKSVPDFWVTNDSEVVIAALQRLAAQRG